MDPQKVLDAVHGTTRCSQGESNKVNKKLKKRCVRAVARGTNRVVSSCFGPEVEILEYKVAS